MTPLSDALTAAQRRALGALEKAYVAGHIEPEQLTEGMVACGVSDHVEIAFLVASLDVLKEWGVAAPNMTERVAETELASQRQRDYILQLCAEKKKQPPEDLSMLTKAEASGIIGQLTSAPDQYNPAASRVPF